MPKDRRPAPLRYADLPISVTESALVRQKQKRLFGYLSRPLVDDLSTFCRGRNVLEVYAGRGFLTALLAEQGVSIKATSLRSGHDGSEHLGHVADVEELHAVEAVARYADWMDILLVSWPTTDQGMERIAAMLPPNIPIIFLGEVTDYSCSPAFLGGCATDAFFERVEEIPGSAGQIRYPAPGPEQVKIFRTRR